MRALLMRERRAALNLLNGLEQAGALTIGRGQKDLLTDSILLHLTYWIPFADLLASGGVDDSRAQAAAIARVMLMVTPWLREPEQSQFRNLAADYLRHSN